MEEVSVLIGRSQSGDKEAREVLIEKNLGLVHHIVKRFLGRGYDPEDLFQIGSIGLLKAVDKFDMSYDVKFSTYAVPMIIGEIKRYLRDDGILKVSRSLKEKHYRIYQVREALTRRLEREPTTGEMAEEMDAAMCCRGFVGEYKTQKTSTFRKQDILSILLMIGVTGIFIYFEDLWK